MHIFRNSNVALWWDLCVVLERCQECHWGSSRSSEAMATTSVVGSMLRRWQLSSNELVRRQRGSELKS